jgi:hypothetical protein
LLDGISKMNKKLLTAVCSFALTAGMAYPSVAGESPGPMAVAADAVVVRPACFAATAIGAVIFVVALPVAATSHSVKKTARALVVKPAKATFKRPMGDLDALQNY